MATTTTNTKALSDSAKEILAQDGDLLRNIIQQVLQEILEAEMDQALGATKSERSDKRRGYRSGCYLFLDTIFQYFNRSSVKPSEVLQ